MNNSSKVADIYRNAGEAFIILSEIMEKLELEDDATDYTDQEIALLQVAVANFSIELADVSTLVKNRRLLERDKAITVKSSHTSKGNKGTASTKTSTKSHPPYESSETDQPKGNREFKRKHVDDLKVVEKSTPVPKKPNLSQARAPSKIEHNSKEPITNATKQTRTPSLPIASAPVATGTSNVHRLQNAANLPVKNQTVQPIRTNHGQASGSNPANLQSPTSPVRLPSGSAYRLQTGQTIKLLPGQVVRLPSGQIIKAHSIPSSALRAPYQAPQSSQAQSVGDTQRRGVVVGYGPTKTVAKGPNSRNT